LLFLNQLQMLHCPESSSTRLARETFRPVQPESPRSVDEIVRERASPAVKSALKSLLEAPAAALKSGGRRGGDRRGSATAAEGADG
jgi:hypothetical protein